MITYSIVTEKNMFEVLKSKVELYSARQGSMPNKARERERRVGIYNIYTVYLAYIYGVVVASNCGISFSNRFPSVFVLLFAKVLQEHQYKGFEGTREVLEVLQHLNEVQYGCGGMA